MAIALLADEDLDHTIVRGLRRRNPAFDITTVRDAGLSGVADHRVLEYAASVGRTVVSHDANTMIDTAYARIARGRPMTGLIIVRKSASLAVILEDLELAATATTPEEWLNCVGYVPL